MDRMRRTYVRQDSSTSSTGTPGGMSPLAHRHTRSGGAGIGLGNRSQQTKAAAARLAQVMAHKQPGDSDDEEDDLDLYDGAASSGLGLVGTRPAAGTLSSGRGLLGARTAAGTTSSGRGLVGTRPGARSPSPLTSVRTSTDQDGDGRFGSAIRSSHSAGSVEQQQTSSRYSLSGRSSHSSSVGKISPAVSVPVTRPYQSTNSAEPEVSPNADSTVSPRAGKISSAYSGVGNRSSQSTNSAEPVVSPYARSTASPAVGKISSAYSGIGNRSSQSTNSAEPVVSSYARSTASPAVGKTSSAYSGIGSRSSQSTNSAEPVVSPYADSTVSPGVGKISSAYAGIGNRLSQSTNSAEPVVSSYARSTASPAVGKTSSAYSGIGNRSSQSTKTEQPIRSLFNRSYPSAEQVQPPSDDSSSPVEHENTSTPITSLRSFRSNSMEQPNSARTNVVGRPSVGLKPVTMVPSAVPVTLKAATETQPDIRKEKKSVLQPTASSDLQDELDMLQEENGSLLEKLRLAEEKCEEAEVRARQLEQQREAALKAATRNSGGTGGEVAALRIEAETAKDEAASLRSMTQRMILTQEEMEEVVLKRCWLARYWCLCVRHGIHAEIATSRYEYWSAFAPLPVEVVLAAAERAKEDGGVANDAEERERKLQQRDDLSGEGNVENMLLVDKGLKELTCLKVEEALVIVMAQNRRAGSGALAATDELKLPIEGANYSEGFELTEEEQEDVTFKQAWLAYFWRRVKNHGLEPDIANERLQYWIERRSRMPVSNDAVDVERGLMELKKLAIEIKLWEISRLSVDPDSSQKTVLDFDS